MNISITNISWNMPEGEFREIFERYGEVTYCRLQSTDGRPIGSVAMASEAEGQAAIDALDGQEVDGRNWSVKPA